MSRSGIKWIVPFILVATGSGCTYLPVSPSTEAEKIAQLVEQQQYGQAQAILAQVPESAPDYDQLASLRKSIDKQAAAYQRKTLIAGKKLERQGEWYKAQLHYQQALNKLLEGKKLQAAQDELQLKIDARVATLEIELLMARGEWLKQRLTIQTKLSPLLPRKRFAAWRHEAVKKEGKKVAAELGLVGKRAVQQGEFSLAAQSFDLALELHPDPVIEEARKALSNRKQRAIVKNKKDALKALSISLQEALNERRLGEASVIAIQLEKQGSPNEEEQRLIQQLNRDIRKQVIEELELGAGHYGRGEYTQAISIWSNVLALEPDNTEAAIRITRAKRVVEKLRQLSEDKVE